MRTERLNCVMFTFIFLVGTLTYSCSQTDKIDNRKQFQQAEEFFRTGEFKKAEILLDKIKANSILDTVLQKDIEVIEAKIERIRLDFPNSEPKIMEELKRWFPKLDIKTFETWEKSKKLEMMYIDGEKHYFRNAVSNLFRIDSFAMKERTRGIDPLDQFCLNHTAKFMAMADSGIITGNPTYKFRINYTITVKPDVVPADEVIRCWMPFPRNSYPRQKNVRLLKVNSGNFYIAPDSFQQRSLYIEKHARKGEPIVFFYSAEFETIPQYVPIGTIKIKPYLTDSELFKNFTAERPPHIVFSDEMKQLSASLTHGLTNPYEKVRSIFMWIDKNIPWTSALEYSIIENIPHYVLENRHGDCGMKTLLFMTLARIAGIPCKWQSGWMLHPGEVNLHDWCEVYYEGIGWVPVDQSFGMQDTDDQYLKYFYSSGIDAYRLIVNDDYGRLFDPQKKFFRSEPIDFQRGEVEWKGGNLYFDKWDYQMNVTYISP